MFLLVPVAAIGRSAARRLPGKLIFAKRTSRGTGQSKIPSETDSEKKKTLDQSKTWRAEGPQVVCVLPQICVNPFVSPPSSRGKGVFPKQIQIRICVAALRAHSCEEARKNLRKKIAAIRFRKGHLFFSFSRNAYSRGRPSPRDATMLRWISLVPAAIVLDTAVRYMRDIRPFSFACADPGSRPPYMPSNWSPV